MRSRSRLLLVERAGEERVAAALALQVGVKSERIEVAVALLERQRLDGLAPETSSGWSRRSGSMAARAL